MAEPSSLADARAAAGSLGARALLPTERVALEDCPGRVAAEDVAAAFALPGFDSSAMDGWAVRAPDVAGAAADAPVVLVASGESRAGHPGDEVVSAGHAARISTGARLPRGADAVVRVEDVEVTDAGVVVRVPVDPGRDVRRAGEDVAVGDLAVRAGDALAPGHVALLAGLGVGSVRCRRRPRVLVVVTGDELRPAPDGGARPAADGGPSSPPGTTDGAPDDGAPAPGPVDAAADDAARAVAGRIRDVGGPALAAVLRALGADVVAVRHAGDTLGETIAALDPDGVDLVLSTGGVSVGPHDHVREALERLGGVPVVESLDLQPGRPTWLGSVPSTDAGAGRVVPVLALPGNPGAAITVATLLATPLLRGMAGQAPAVPVHARLADDERGGRRVRALRVALDEDDEGRRVARVLHGQQAHRLASFPATEAFALISAGEDPLAAGTRVEVVRVPGGR